MTAAVTEVSEVGFSQWPVWLAKQTVKTETSAAFLGIG